MITTQVPESWRDLQSEVGRILEECGFDVEVEKTVKTARGKVELDVYAEEIVDGRRYSIVCECKRWKQNIPQTVVHSLRTVVGDFGANMGYLLVTSGFQSGADAASEFTNIELVTWGGFQDLFEATWLKKYLVPRVTEDLDLIMEYTEPLVPNWFLRVSDSDKVLLKELRAKYEDFGMLMMMFTVYGRAIGPRSFPQLPLRINDQEVFPGGKRVPEEILDAKAYRDFLEASLTYGKRGIEEFQAIKARNRLD